MARQEKGSSQEFGQLVGMFLVVFIVVFLLGFVCCLFVSFGSFCVWWR